MKAAFALLFLIGALFQFASAQTQTKLEGQVVCCEDCWNRAD
jgi:hypothetical protein